MTMAMMMPTQISKSQFKAKALELFRQIESSGESVIVTDNGRPSIEVRPFRTALPTVFEQLRGTVLFYHDPTLPVGEDDWDVLP